MSKYLDQRLQTEAYELPYDSMTPAQIRLSTAEAAAADDDALLAVFTATTSATTKSTFLAQPPCARNITITSGGTAASVPSGKITVHGTDIAGIEISEEFALTADTAFTGVGTKAFAHVSSIDFPAMDGSGVTFKVGFGDLYGIPYKLAAKPIALGSVDGAQEAVSLTVSGSVTALNTFTFSSAPAGEAVTLLLFV